MRFQKQHFSFLHKSFRAMSTEPRVIVVGGGLAGLSAAVEAATHSAVQVLLFDKEQRVG